MGKFDHDQSYFFSGTIVKELTHPELQKVTELYDISVVGEKMTLACGDDGVMHFQMVYDALVK